MTGGGGFLGQAIVRQFLARGDQARIFARGDYPALVAEGAELQRGDLQDAAALDRACAGVDAVVHAAALAGGWGDPRRFEAVNVQGSRNVVAGCRAAGVQRLIYTSSPSVVSRPGPMEGVDESLPYPDRYLAHYPRTKAQGERETLAASDDSLATVALRPRWIWGPGDPHLLPRLLDRHDAGRLRRIGGGDPLVDTVYVDNAAEAHLQAIDRLGEGADIAGRAYFITNGEPIGLWTLVDRMMAAAGRPPVKGTAPRWAVKAAGATLEALHGAFGIDREPLMTRFGAAELSRAAWYDISAARRDLGYEPRVSLDEGLERLARWFEGDRTSP